MQTTKFSRVVVLKVFCFCFVYVNNRYREDKNLLPHFPLGIFPKYISFLSILYFVAWTLLRIVTLSFKRDSKTSFYDDRHFTALQLAINLVWNCRKQVFFHSSCCDPFDSICSNRLGNCFRAALLTMNTCKRFIFAVSLSHSAYKWFTSVINFSWE